VDAGWLSRFRCQVRVVDIRGPEETAEVRLPFGELVPQERLLRHSLHWHADEPVVLVDRSGRRASRAAHMLEDMGFTRVASLTGGVLGWVATGRPVVRGAPNPPSQPEPEPVGMSLDVDTIESHLRSRQGMRWVKAAVLLLGGSRSCVDGRELMPVVGTPGGDAGELVIALTALETVRGKPLSDDEIDQLYEAYLDAFGRFYMHTDTHALEALIDDERFRREAENVGIERFVRDPPEALEEPLAELLSQTEHVGCGHLRLTLEHPEEYEVRPGLVRGIIRRTLRRAWDDGPIDLVVLHGSHKESAVVEIKLDREIHPFTFIPTVAPRLADHELFVDHPEVNDWLRREGAAFLFTEDPWLQDHPEARDPLIARVEELGRLHLNNSVRHLASHLPVFIAHVLDEEGHVRVERP